MDQQRRQDDARALVPQAVALEAQLREAGVHLQRGGERARALDGDAVAAQVQGSERGQAAQRRRDGLDPA
jgi:hypothetical protein